MTNRLYIAAKAPRAGVAKTRLGQAIGHDAAIELYRAFLQDLACRFADAPFEVGWYVTPPDAWQELAPLLGTRHSSVLAQGDGDWTERQRTLFRYASERGEERTVLVASDSPQLAVETVIEAFEQLDHHDVVFGPAFDDGYYLIGMRGWHDVLQGIPMSKGRVLERIVARTGQLGLSVGTVEATFDIDEPGDLHRLEPLLHNRADLAATRAAFVRLGLFSLAQGSYRFAAD